MIDSMAAAQLLTETGMLAEEDVKRILPFCLSACDEITERLRSVNFEKSPSVIMACAGLAYYRYCLTLHAVGEDFSTFRAGDITVSRSPSALLEGAERFRDESLAAAARYLTDVDFAFEAVEL